MKLKLKHLAPYLPYGFLYGIYENQKVIIRGMNYNSDYLNIDFEINNHNKVSSTCFFNEIKPILRPLSDLTKEIEVNGEEFIPMVKLLEEHLTIYTKHIVSKIKFNVLGVYSKNFKYQKCNNYYIEYNEKGSTTINQLIYDDTFYRFTLRQIVPEGKFLGMSYRSLDNMLLEWHFDVFGLIEKDLAIDINTLQK